MAFITILILVPLSSQDIKHIHNFLDSQYT